MPKTFEQIRKEGFSFKVDVEGLPSMFMTGNSPAEVKAHLRTLVKQPSMIKGVKRVTKHDKKKELRKRSIDEGNLPDDGTTAARKLASRMTPGQNEDIEKLSSARLKWHVKTGIQHGGYTNKEIDAEHKRRQKVEPNYDSVKPKLENRRDRLRAKFAAVGKDMKKTNDELKKISQDYKDRFQSDKKKEEGLTLGKLRKGLYKAAKIGGDVQAIRKGKVGKRIVRRAAGKATGKMLGKLFK